MTDPRILNALRAAHVYARGFRDRNIPAAAMLGGEDLVFTYTITTLAGDYFGAAEDRATTLAAFALGYAWGRLQAAEVDVTTSKGGA